VVDVAEAIRIRRRVVMFIDLLRRQMIISRMVRGYQEQCHLYLLRRAFDALSQNRELSQQFNTRIEVQVSTLLDQTHMDML
jgi:hypothetical protein